MSRRGTIKEYAEELLCHVSFVDIYGRDIGYDYVHILAMIRKRFPKSSATRAGGNFGRGGFTKAALRYIRAQMTCRLPARLRSRRRMAREYTRVLLTHKNAAGVGLTFLSVRRRVRVKFPEQPMLSMHHVVGNMVRRGVVMPTRPGDAT